MDILPEGELSVFSLEKFFFSSSSSSSSSF